MTPYHVAIPSLGRSDTIQGKTIECLLKLGVKPSQIDIYVDDFEADLYRNKLEPSSYNKIISVKPCSLAEKRNYIHSNYRLGAKLIVCDDDLKGLLYKPHPESTKLKEMNEAQWKNLVSNAFDCCETFGATLWGVYPVVNAYFMKLNFSADLRFIIGQLYGRIVDHSDETLLADTVKDDYELTIKSFIKDNAVIRFNYVAVNSKVYSGVGGLSGIRTPELSAQAASYLTKNWPQYVATKVKLGKTGHVEVRLKSPWRKVYDVILDG